MSESFDKLQKIKADIEAEQPDSMEALEQSHQIPRHQEHHQAAVREIRNIANEQKEYGQLVNSVKEAADPKYASLQMSLETAAEQAAVQTSTSPPRRTTELGARHPVAITMNRIIKDLRTHWLRSG